MKQLVVALVLFLTALTGCTAEHTASAQSPPPHIQLVPTERLPDARVTTQEYFINLNSVHKIECGRQVGTGETINTNRVLTASHVVGGETSCVVVRDGVRVPARVIYDNRAMDYAVLDVPTGSQRRFPLSCDGFVTGQTYFIIGHARGRDFAITRAVATSRYINVRDHESGQPFVHVRVLEGRSVRGMSGGPIVNMDGVQVGTIVAGPTNPNHLLAYSREIKDTYICDNTNNDGVKETEPPSK